MLATILGFLGGLKSLVPEIVKAIGLALSFRAGAKAQQNKMYNKELKDAKDAAKIKSNIIHLSDRDIDKLL